MALHTITQLTISRAQLADLFAEAERRIRAGESDAPPVVDLLTIPEAGVVHADYLIALACQQAVVTHFDADAFTLGHASGKPDSGPALCKELRLKASVLAAVLADEEERSSPGGAPTFDASQFGFSIASAAQGDAR